MKEGLDIFYHHRFSDMLFVRLVLTLLNRFCSLEKLCIHSKIERKVGKDPMYLLSPNMLTLSTINIPHQSGTFVTGDASAQSPEVHSLHEGSLVVFRFGQMYNDMNPSLWYHRVVSLP